MNEVHPRLFLTENYKLVRGAFEINGELLDYGIIYDEDDYYNKLCGLRNSLNLLTWLEKKKKDQKEEKREEKCCTVNDVINFIFCDL